MRQKQTLAAQFTEAYLQKAIHYFDLEDPTDRTKLENPKIVLEKLTGLIIIDEIQRLPNLFPYLRAFIDKVTNGTKILILGSAPRDLIR